LGLGGSFDFGATAAPADTQPGFLPVTPTDTPTSGVYAFASDGWTNAGAGAFNRLTTYGPAGDPSSPRLAPLLRDGEWGYAGGGANNGQFQVTVAPNQDVQVSVYAGDVFAGRDNFNVYVGTPSNPLSTRLNPSLDTFKTTMQSAFQFVSYSGVFNPGANSALLITFETVYGGASNYWTVNGVDVRPVGLIAPLTLTRVGGNATVPA